MKSVLAFLILGLAFTAQAREVQGKLTSPVEVTVLSEETGIVSKYTAALKYVDIDETSVNIDSGIRAMCGNNLGLLAEDAEISFTSGDGIEETVIVKKSEGKRKVYVNGDCQQGGQIRVQLSLTTDDEPILADDLK